MEDIFQREEMEPREDKLKHIDNWEDLLPVDFLKKIQGTHSWKERLQIFKKILKGQQVEIFIYWEHTRRGGIQPIYESYP